MVKNKKSYTWEEIKEFLIKELKKTKHILTWGTIGSCNLENDIDVIITKKPGHKTSDFYKEIHNLFDFLNNYLNKKYNTKVIRFSFIKKESLKLSNYKKNDLAFHTMIYTSYPQIRRDWDWALLNDDKGIKKTLIESYNCLIGDLKDLFSKEFMEEQYSDPIFVLLYIYDRINSNYSEEFLVEVMNDAYDYLFRKKLDLKTLVAKNEKDVRKIFYKLCDILDNLNKKYSIK